MKQIARVRYGDPPRCPRCHDPRLTRTGRIRELECPRCRLSVGVTSNTVFHKSKLPIQDWFSLFFMLSHMVGGTSVSFIVRHLGISRLAAYRMISATRLHMRALEKPRMFGGEGKVVQIDETQLPKIRMAGPRGSRPAIVFGMWDQDGLYARVVDNRSRAVLLPIIAERVQPGSTVVTDFHRSYACLGRIGYRHVALNHSKGEWATRAGLSMSGIESFWANLKYFLRSERRFPKISTLDGYIAEALWRQNSTRLGLCPFEALIAEFPCVDLMKLTSGAKPYRGPPSH